MRQSDIQKKLDQADIFYSFSEKNYALIDYGEKEVDWTVRLSPHYFNTEAGVEKVVEVIKSL